MRGLLLLCFDYSNVAVDEFNDWYDTEHIPERKRTRGILNARRWLNISNPRISVASYDLESINALQNPEYLAISGSNLLPWSKRIIGKCTQVLRFEGRQLLPGDSLADDSSRILLVAGANVTEGKTIVKGTYPAHVSRMVKVAGIVSVRIFEGINKSVQFLELYELESASVFKSPEWIRAETDAPDGFGNLQSRAKLVLLCQPYSRTGSRRVFN